MYYPLTEAKWENNIYIRIQSSLLVLNLCPLLYVVTQTDNDLVSIVSSTIANNNYDKSD